ncbi:hypothetical protein LDENG_00106520 [Lucifuga dentata]|nr:hypothetical protein LDENG_00106520 [Lucifuga dentata]
MSSPYLQHTAGHCSGSCLPQVVYYHAGAEEGNGVLLQRLLSRCTHTHHYEGL